MGAYQTMGYVDEKYYQTIRLSPALGVSLMDPKLIQRLYGRGMSDDDYAIEGVPGYPALSVSFRQNRFLMNLWKSKESIDPAIYDGNIRIEYQGTIVPYEESVAAWDRAYNKSRFDIGTFVHARTLLGFNRLKDVRYTIHYDDPRYAPQTGDLGDLDCFQTPSKSQEIDDVLPPEMVQLPNDLRIPEKFWTTEDESFADSGALQEKATVQWPAQSTRKPAAATPKKDSVPSPAQENPKTPKIDTSSYAIPKDSRAYPHFASTKRETIRCDNTSGTRGDYFVYLNLNRTFTVSSRPDLCAECFGVRDGVGNRYKLETELKLRKRGSSSSEYDFAGVYASVIASHLDVSKVYQGRSFVLPFFSAEISRFGTTNWMIYNPNQANDLLINMPLTRAVASPDLAQSHYLAISGEIRRYMSQTDPSEPKLPSNIRANIHLFPFEPSTAAPIDVLKGADLFCKRDLY